MQKLTTECQLSTLTLSRYIILKIQLNLQPPNALVH